MEAVAVEPVCELVGVVIAVHSVNVILQHADNALELSRIPWVFGGYTQVRVLAHNAMQLLLQVEKIAHGAFPLV